MRARGERGTWELAKKKAQERRWGSGVRLGRAQFLTRRHRLSCVPLQTVKERPTIPKPQIEGSLWMRNSSVPTGNRLKGRFEGRWDKPSSWQREELQRMEDGS